MKSIPANHCLVALGAAALVCSAPLGAADFTVHEWGTFTSVSGSDGRLLPGLEVEEEPLPAFVHSHAGVPPANKGWDRPVANVTIKMETPVLYFYSDAARAVRIDVGFHGGSISQWYPERIAGETLPADVPLSSTPGNGFGLASLPAIDFARGFEGSVSWRVDVLPAAAPDKISAPREWETPQWPRARIAGANRVRGPGGEVEGFVFYRGIGNFSPPLRVTGDNAGRVRLENTGRDRIPFVFIYDRRPSWDRNDAMVWWHGALAAGESHAELTLQSFHGGPARKIREETLPAALMAAGLNRAEADALLATWRESYFERPGLRVFWIVPRAFTDAVLPLTITPRPERLERVLVGRTEVLTPQFEAELQRGFAADGGKRWETDRYFRAYRERVRQRGSAVGVAPASAAP